MKAMLKLKKLIETDRTSSERKLKNFTGTKNLHAPSKKCCVQKKIPVMMKKITNGFLFSKALLEGLGSA
jgi:hypothetical protein